MTRRYVWVSKRRLGSRYCGASQACFSCHLQRGNDRSEAAVDAEHNLYGLWGKWKISRSCQLPWIRNLAFAVPPWLVMKAMPNADELALRIYQVRDIINKQLNTVLRSLEKLDKVSCRMWKDMVDMRREKKVVVLRELCRAIIYSTKIEIM
jgi:hypothetical protein